MAWRHTWLCQPSPSLGPWWFITILKRCGLGAEIDAVAPWDCLCKAFRSEIVLDLYNQWGISALNILAFRKIYSYLSSLFPTLVIVYILTMSAPRNFRKILDIDPDSSDFTCVGIKPNGERCGVLKQFIGGEKISRASSLLTEMDTLPLRGSYLCLEELALNTLCPRWHSIAEYNHVAAITQLWTQKIQQLERKEAKDKASVIKETATRRAIAIEEKEASVKERLEEVTCMLLATHISRHLTLWPSRYLVYHSPHRQIAPLRLWRRI